MEIVQRSLHDRHGPLVRIAPNEITTSDPSAIPQIYRTSRPFLEKSDWYLAWRAPTPNSQPDLFSNTNERAHSAYRKVVSAAYSMTSVLRSSDKIDTTTALLVEKFKGFADREEIFDLGVWLERYTNDNIGALFFGDQLGFVNEGIDYGDFIKSYHSFMPFLSTVSMAPRWVQPALWVFAFTTPKLLSAVMAFGGIRTRVDIEIAKVKARPHETTAKQDDILSQLLATVHGKGAETFQDEKGNQVSFKEADVINEAGAAISVGADSTSIALRAIFYYLMKHPETMAKVTMEIDGTFDDGSLSFPIGYKQAVSELPYMNAVIKEATRLFPSFAVHMPRVSLQDGLQLSGVFIPPGYSVGMNPAVVHYNKDIFGQDAHLFRPERWLEGDTSAMDRAILLFGAGTRTCIGKQIAMVQMHKLVPEILRRFTIEMAHDRPWKTHNALFVSQSDIICKIKRREL